MTRIGITSYALLIVTGCIALAMMLWSDRKKGNVNFLSPLRWAGFSIFLQFVIQPFNHIYYDEIGYYDLVTSELIDPMAIACLIATLGFCIGWILFAPSKERLKKRNNNRGNPFIDRQAWNSQYEKTLHYIRPLFYWILLLVPAFMALAALYFHGTAYEEFMKRGTSKSMMFEATHWWDIFLFALNSMIAFGIIGLVGAGNRILSLRSFISISVLLFYFLLLLSLHGRLRVMTLVFAVLGMLAAKLSRNALRLSATVLCVLLLIFIPVYGTIRAHFSYGMKSDEVTKLLQAQDRSGGFYYALAMKGDLSAWESGTQLLQAVPAHHDYLYGATIFYLFVYPIPRAIWPNKPIADPMLVLVEAGIGYGLKTEPGGNTAFSLPGELYVNFGWLGIIIGMFLLGGLSRWVYEDLSYPPNNPIKYAELGIYAVFIILILRGNFTTLTVHYLTNIFWFWLFRYLVRKVR